MNWTKREKDLVTAFAYMVHYKRMSIYKAITDLKYAWLRDRSWESIRSQLNRERKAIMLHYIDIGLTIFEPLADLPSYRLEPRLMAKITPVHLSVDGGGSPSET